LVVTSFQSYLDEKAETETQGRFLPLSSRNCPSEKKSFFSGCFQSFFSAWNGFVFSVFDLIDFHSFQTKESSFYRVLDLSIVPESLPCFSTTSSHNGSF